MNSMYMFEKGMIQMRAFSKVIISQRNMIFPNSFPLMSLAGYQGVIFFKSPFGENKLQLWASINNRIVLIE